MNPRVNHRTAARSRSHERGGRVAWLVGVLLLFLHLGCGPEEASQSKSASDPAAPSAAIGAGMVRRVASLSPLATRLLLELELVDRIVAVDAESGDLPGLGGRPQVPAAEPEAFLALTAVEPDLVVLPESRAGLAARLAGANIRTVVVAVHDFDDGFTLWGELAGRLGVADAARPRIALASRPLAQLAAESYGFSRPRVAAIESFDPLMLAGDHRFATALIEIAGGESVTHRGSESAIPIDRAGLLQLAPELLFHARPAPIAEAERRALVESFAEVAPLVIVEFEPERFYADESIEAARTLRDAIAARAHPRADARQALTP